MKRTNIAFVAALAALVSSPFVGGCFDPEDPPPADGTEAGTASGSSGELGSSGGSSSSSGEPGPSCADYCGLIEDHCDDEFEQYPGDAACEALCEVMPPGTEQDELGNTVGCRMFHTLLAGEQEDPHCHHAGPAGDGTCGSNCESFCTLALGVCVGDNAVWPGSEACIADCNRFAEEPKYTTAAPDEDSFACRMHHLTLASLQPDVHCDHVALVSPVCQ